ncbi:hypothetical protein [Paenibacillus amylolyticus]|uniref:hypothetical protein n=1 Tax=Paenibacillus amylolyticus TaxID=1451 RepID=UPI003EBEBAE8
MRKFTSVGLSLIMLLVLCAPISAQSLENTNQNEIPQEGIVLPVGEFSELYGKKDSLETIKAVDDDMRASITIEAAFSQNEEVMLKAKINYSNEIKELNATGKLFNSYKQQFGSNSIVGEINDKEGNFDVLLFEIYNDTDTTKAITDPMYKTKPHLKLYLTDHENNILLFEKDIPEEFQNIIVKNSEQPDSKHDLFWFASVIKPIEQKEIPVSKEMMDIVQQDKASVVTPTAVGSYSDWVHTTTYYTSYVAGGDTIKNYSLPYGTWKVTNVSPSSTWINTFKIAEHVQVNGRKVNAQNLFEYRNVILNTAVGDKSSIDMSIVDGKMVGKGSGSSLAMLVAEKAWKTALPAAPSISTIKSWITSANTAFSSKNVTLGSSNIRLSNDAATVSSVSSQNYTLYSNTTNASNGHYLQLNTNVQYNGPANSSASTNGVMRIDWKVYLNNSLYNSQTKDITFNYSVKSK